MRLGIWIGLLAAGGLTTGVLGASFTSRAIQDYRTAYEPTYSAAYPAPAYDASFSEQAEYARPDLSSDDWDDPQLAPLGIPAPTYGNDRWEPGYAYNEVPTYSEPDYDYPDNNAYAPSTAHDLQGSRRFDTQPLDAAADAAARAGSVVQDVIEAEQQSD